MKILVLNGSPKGEKSNTFKITRSFLEGMQKAGENNIEIMNISKADIDHCLGCFNCWTRTPGTCIIKDDMQVYLQKYIEADIIIWSFPLYYFSMPSKIKAFMDRLLPTNLPYMAEENGQCGHQPRYDLSHQRYVLISTCGFYEVEKNYASLFKQFDILYRGRLTKIICSEGELFSVPNLQKRTAEYIAHAHQAGFEYTKSGEITSQTASFLAEKLYPPQAFVEMADASWEINEPAGKNQNNDRSKNFMRQMAAVYNPATWRGKDIVIEMHFTELDKTYQLCLDSEKCTLKTEDFSPYTTRIETPFSVWMDISEGRLNGAQAMMNKQYRVKGDFDTMLNMDKYFSITPKVSHPEKIREDNKKTNMNLLLAPWILLWILLPINPMIGGACGIAAVSILPLLSARFKITLYEKINLPLISAIGLLALLGGDSQIPVILSYMLIGSVWLASCLTVIPLTAHYSVNDYGEEYLSNPLFIKTNRILTIMWGLVFYLTAVSSTFLMQSPLAGYTGLVNSLAPALMGAFTVWFQKWYPARVAAG